MTLLVTQQTYLLLYVSIGSRVEPLISMFSVYKRLDLLPLLINRRSRLLEKRYQASLGMVQIFLKTCFMSV